MKEFKYDFILLFCYCHVVSYCQSVYGFVCTCVMELDCSTFKTQVLMFSLLRG